jgi:hypothetical protein
MGPATKFVDDGCFFRILRKDIAAYNLGRAEKRARLLARSNGKPNQRRGRLWWDGDQHDDETVEELTEDLRFPLVDLSHTSPRSEEDARFSYAACDIDLLSAWLRIPWSLQKTQAFAASAIFIGFLWNLDARTVALPDQKRLLYLAGIKTWLRQHDHNLEEAEQLLGRLQHTCFVVPLGQAYCVALMHFICLYAKDLGNSPQKQLRASRQAHRDMEWWASTLSYQHTKQGIPKPVRVAEAAAYSDASSGVGIGVVIGGRWRAWRLLPGWQSDKRDIQWAEAIGVELLALYAFTQTDLHLRLWCDNQSVIGGWKKGRSHNQPVNDVFKRLLAHLHGLRCSAHLAYVRSAVNPADNPSRGVYSSRNLLLPPIPLPEELQRFVIDFDQPRTSHELLRSSIRPAPKPARPADPPDSTEPCDELDNFHHSNRP